MATWQGGRQVVHFTNRKNAPFLLFHITRDATRPVGAILDIHRGRRTTNQTRDVRILPGGCPREAGSYGARQSEGMKTGLSYW